MEGSVEDVAACSVCFDPFEEIEGHVPRLLKCGHSFCETCLVLIACEEETSSRICCPKCRQETPLTGDGVALLPRNFDLLEMIRTKPFDVPREDGKVVECHNCIEEMKTIEGIGKGFIPKATLYCESCTVFLCYACDQAIHFRGIMTKHKRVGTHEVTKPLARCSKHPDKHIEFWCSSDGEGVCTYCCIAGSHVGHKVQTLEEAWVDINKQAEEELEVIEKEIGRLEQLKEDNNKTKEEGIQSAEKAKQELDRKKQYLLSVIQQKCNEINKEILDWENEFSMGVNERDEALRGKINELRAKANEMKNMRNDKAAWISEPRGLTKSQKKEELIGPSCWEGRVIDFIPVGNAAAMAMNIGGIIKSTRGQTKRKQSDVTGNTPFIGPQNRKRQKVKQSRPGPQTGFLFFVQQERESVAQENPLMSFGDVTSVLSKKWQKLPAHKKEEYSEQARKDRERYERNQIFSSSEEE